MTREEFAKLLKRFLDRSDRFLISGHIRPDGDAVGSSTALALAIRNMGKEAILVQDGDASRYNRVVEAVPLLKEDVKMKDAGREFKSGSDFAFIMVDCSEPERCGRAGDALMAAVSTLSIDHHVTSGDAADFSYSEPETSSASEILYWLFKILDIEVTLPMANALFMGLAYDTGGFRHNNVSEDSFRMASDLRRIGVDSSFYMNYLFYTKNLSEESALAASVLKSQLVDDRYLFSVMSQDDFARIGVSPKEADGVAGQLTEIAEAQCVVYIRQIEDHTIRVNMRSKTDDIDVARIASLFGGGGHVRAAGCTFTGQALLNVKESILEALRRQRQEKEA